MAQRCRSSTMINVNSVTGLFRCAALASQQPQQMALSRSTQEQLSWASEQEKEMGEKNHRSKISHEEASAKACEVIMVLHERSLLT